jgi:hypothetical protein
MRTARTETGKTVKANQKERLERANATPDEVTGRDRKRP